ncbi:MAG: RNA polymerase sigma factor [Schleiferiaceae bacterium]|jgi:RNA polymerase sigma-70 factor (ECF subfamily)|nr:RNA polymerase sigma factor [Schleiferiaceae bacterium]
MSNTEFEKLVYELNETLYRFAFFKTGREDLAKDAVQECMVKLWNEQKPLNHYLNPKAYCITLVKNKCIDLLRAENTRKNYELQNDQNRYELPSDERLDVEEKLRIMDSYLEKLNEKQASALKLRDYEGYSYAEIADLLGVSEANTKVLIHRGRMAIKKLITKSNGLRSTAY